MKLTYPLALALMLAAAGCQSNKKPETASASMDKLAPTPEMQNAYNAAYSPTPMQASYTPAPVSATIETSTPVAATDISTASAGGSKYTIKPHDTLFAIAAAHYGSGGKWKKIADANPNLNPKALKVGQTITLP